MPYRLTFSEEFNDLRFYNQGGKWDPSWWYMPNGSKSGDTWYVNPQYGPTAAANPFSVQDGVLSIWGESSDPALRGSMKNAHYTGGMLTSYHTFAQTYGYFEMRAQMPDSEGSWPTFWLLPTDGSWPPELDVVEFLGSAPTSVHTTAHSKVRGDTYVGSDHYQTAGHTYNVPGLTTGFHTYGMDWQRDDITWYLDGQEIFRTETPADMHKPMYLVVTQGFGTHGSWGGGPDTANPHAELKIDYIRAYSDFEI